MILIYLACKDSDDTQPVSVVNEEDHTVKVPLEQVINDNPQVVVGETETKYSMQVVKPDPSVDYKIAKIIPDLSVDYKIIIVDPGSGKKATGLNDYLEGILREKLLLKQRGSAGDESLDVFVKP